MQNRFVGWPVPEMEDVENSRTVDLRACYAPHVYCPGKGWMQAYSWAFVKKMALLCRIGQLREVTTWQEPQSSAWWFLRYIGSLVDGV